MWETIAGGATGRDCRGKKRRSSATPVRRQRRWVDGCPDYARGRVPRRYHRTPPQQKSTTPYVRRAVGSAMLYVAPASNLRAPIARVTRPIAARSSSNVRAPLRSPVWNIVVGSDTMPRNRRLPTDRRPRASTCLWWCSHESPSPRPPGRCAADAPPRPSRHGCTAMKNHSVRQRREQAHGKLGAGVDCTIRCREPRRCDRSTCR